MVNCPVCAELIEPGLSSCPHCDSNLTMAPDPEQAPRKSSAPIWILLIGGGVISACCIFGILIALLLPAVQQAREAARRSACGNNLKQIGLALHNYHDVYNTYPPAYIPDATGKPMHSWRVLILPFIDEAPMHDAYDFGKPWDHPDNLAVTRNIPLVFRCPSAPAQLASAQYVFITGKGTCFDGSKGIRLRDIDDGPSQTLLVVEAHDQVMQWSEPRDLDFMDLVSNPGGTTGPSTAHIGGFHALRVDGSVTFISESIDPEILKALVTPRGKETVGEY